MHHSEYWNPLVPELTVRAVTDSLHFYTLLGRGVNFQVDVPNLKSVAELLLAGGYALFEEPNERWYATPESHEERQIELLVQDPDGYLLRFVEALGSRGTTPNPSDEPTASGLRPPEAAHPNRWAPQE